ncbi:VOC family protein [Paralimibaculum aggregatum]|uniref:VOC family protein n=1 Tax=Paralimibaculum aggregatum TaxID=3036245 RepID=A0ABQ6LC27_9RHOB|nr:VOC family protein [Limibaculum sp. NKW23]GMG80941.1 VOC family protein [Limibaculum sp. NKW23]
MTHPSRLGGISIDCRTGDLAGAAGFWAGALGRQAAPGGERYVRLGRVGGLTVEVQAVDHAPRVHLDIEAADVAAEVARLEGLGAVRLRAVEDWVVMEAPTGHRFCVVPAEPEGEGRA